MTRAELAALERREVLILGFGREGRATLAFLRRRFPDKVIGVADQRRAEELDEQGRRLADASEPLRLHLGPSYLERLGDYDVILKAPGIPPGKPEIRSACARGSRLSSHTEIFLALCDRTVVGVTGTKGKSTTSALIHAILAHAGRESHLVGNFGAPPLPLLEESSADAVFVCELSSYQLHGLTRSPPIAVLLNVFTEHTDYHGSHAAYVEAKSNIARHQCDSDWLVYRADEPATARLAASCPARKIALSMKRHPAPALFVEDGAVVLAPENAPERAVMPVAQIPLLGEFNRYNVMAALAVAHVLEVAPEVGTEAIRAFQPLEHRLEVVGTYGGITFVDASIATVPEATLSHVDVFGPGLKTLLLGGHDRGQDFTALCDRLLELGVETLILFAPAGERIWETMKERDGEGRGTTGEGRGLAQRLPKACFARTMDEAVRLAYEHTPAGGTCLLSPACASFGLFADYRDRGEQFKRHVRNRGEERQ